MTMEQVRQGRKLMAELKLSSKRIEVAVPSNGNRIFFVDTRAGASLALTAYEMVCVQQANDYYTFRVGKWYQHRIR